MIYACKFDNCQLLFNRPWKLKRHEECHLGIKSFVCCEKGCSKSYSTSSHLKRHIKISHGCKEESGLLYVCSFPSCDTSFKTTCGLQKHEKKHLFGHLCNICNRFFLNESVYNKHIFKHQNKHKNFKMSKPTLSANNSDLNVSYLCEECCISFAIKSEFIFHCKRNHEPVTSSFYCGESNCQKEFKHKRNLKQHILQCHLEASMFICGEYGCTKVFKYKRNIKKHILTKHLNIRIKCPVEKCTRTFLFKRSLKRHIGQHENNLIAERKKPKLKCTDVAKQLTNSIVDFAD